MKKKKTSLSEFAFYYPGPIWHSSENIKNLLLFFDGIALLVPRYLQDKPERMDPSLAIPLREKGLLLNIEPEEHVDKEATEQLASALTEIITSGSLDELAKEKDATFHELSMSRLGYYGEQELAKMVFEELKARGLAKDSKDGVSIPMHRHVRILILVLLAQILRPKGIDLGFELIPSTDRSDFVTALTELLNLKPMPSTGQVVASDLETVGVDLSLTPLNEVLDFRKQYLKEHRAYASNVRRFVWDLSQMSPEQRSISLEDRQAELSDLANDLRKLNRKVWRKPASFSLGAAGAVWTAVSGDPLGALFAIGGTLLGLEGSKKIEAGAYSFLFSAPRSYA